MSCLRCKSERVMYVSSKSDDCNYLSIGNEEYNGYLPDEFQYIIGCGDTIEFNLCLDCGQLQGEFPVPKTMVD